jgi:tight adherence protein C
MDELFDYLGRIAGNPGEQQLWITILAAILIFAFAISMMFFFVGLMNPIRKRLRNLSRAKENENVKESLKKEGELFKGVEKKLGALNAYILPKNVEESSRIRAKLMQAGFRAQNAVFIFFGIKTILAMLLPLIYFVTATTSGLQDVKTALYYSIAAMGFGVFFPNIVLERLKLNRQDKIRKGFPDALDLLVVCVEAGLGLDLALRRIAKELKVSHPLLAEELSVVNGEMSAGVARIQALKNFSERIGLDDIKGFVALLAQSIRFGTSIGQTLRIYSEDFRDKRTQRAEELAAKVGTKLIFPMVLCFFPAFFVVAIGGVILKVITVFGN